MVTYDENKETTALISATGLTEIPVVELDQWNYASGVDAEAIRQICGDTTCQKLVGIDDWPPIGRGWLYDGKPWRAKFDCS